MKATRSSWALRRRLASHVYVHVQKGEMSPHRSERQPLIMSALGRKDLSHTFSEGGCWPPELLRSLQEQPSPPGSGSAAASGTEQQSAGGEGGERRRGRRGRKQQMIPQRAALKRLVLSGGQQVHQSQSEGHAQPSQLSVEQASS